MVRGHDPTERDVVTRGGAGLVLAGATATAAGQRYEDRVGDVSGGVGPNIVAVTVSEPWESLVSFEVEFATAPPVGYDLETMSTDELAIGLSPRSDVVAFDEFDYMLIVHGAALYDNTQPEGDEVFWRVVDVAVDGPTVTLTFDWKLVGDPDTLAFFVAASTEGPAETDVYDVYPDEDQLPGLYPRRP